MVDITLWYTIGTVGMVAGTAMLAYGLVLVPAERRRLLAWVVAVPGIAAVAYGLMALGYGALTAGDGVTVFLPRYVDWLLTTPIHVAVVALVVGAGTRLVARIATLQALTIVFGFVGATLSGAGAWLLYLLGGLAFGAVVYTFYGELEGLAANQTDETAALFRKLRSFVVVLWLVYPVIWLLAPAGVGAMDSETTALVVSYIDIVSKVGFGLIAVNDYATMATVRDEFGDEDTAGDGVSGSVADDAPSAD